MKKIVSWLRPPYLHAATGPKIPLCVHGQAAARDRLCVWLDGGGRSKARCRGKARVGNHDMVGGTGERSRGDVGEAVMREMGKGTKRSMGREKRKC